MRVATLNILNSTTSLDERVAHLIDILAEERLDFLCLQEVLPPETAGFDIVERVGQALGLVHTEYHWDARNGVATLSRYPLTLPLAEDKRAEGSHLLVTKSVVDGRDVFVLNLHAVWGSTKGKARLRECILVDDIAQGFFNFPQTRETRPVIILAGDLNALPDSEPIRYLRGLQSHGEHSTTWVDAWEVADPDAEEWTTGDPTYLTQQTSENRRGGVYDTAAAPRRRIDYIMLFEWVWGQAGYPLSTRRFGDEVFLDSKGSKLTVSDHYGVLTELFMPDEA